MTFRFSVPTTTGPLEFHVEPGSSLLFVGANGGGKTRLAVKIETDLGDIAHRISAHRALALDPTVPKISEKIALLGLRTGFANEGAGSQHRPGQRWKSKAATFLLNDYDFLIQALFADQANTSLTTHRNVRSGLTTPAVPTKFERLIEIWGRILPHRTLDITGDDIRTAVTGSTEYYPSSDMSDGERAILYLIGQTLAAASNSLIIFDEPELHIHRSIMSRLWDELEAARPDCGIVFISHDLEFVASREGQKFVLREYEPSVGWTIEPVPEDTGFSEEDTTLILGSRKPVLFVEGNGGSLDQAIYRACYPEWTLVPRGSCQAVIHAVVTMRANANLTRITCAGIIDADGSDQDNTEYLQVRGIWALPVSEIENVMLLPNVVEAIARSEGYEGAPLTAKTTQVFDELFDHASRPENYLPAVMRNVRRRVDNALKKIDLSEADSAIRLGEIYDDATSSVDIQELADTAMSGIQSAVETRNVAELLKWYDNKGLLNIAAKLKGTTKTLFEQWIVRTMRNNTAPLVSESIRAELPEVVAS